MTDRARGCPGHARHWFAPYGSPTVVRPTCSRCGAPNPKWASAVEDEMRQMMGDEYVEEMLQERRAGGSHER